MCLTPYTYRDKSTNELKNAPCQKCPECRNLFSKHMSDRIRIECMNNGYTPYFITYTIAPEYYVMSAKDLHEYIVKYHKIIRKEKQIKFVYAIEFGDKTGRLHFHEILLIQYNDIISVYNFIIQYYDLGFIKVEKANLKNIHYTVSYLYDGVYKRAFSKGIGSIIDNQLYEFCKNHNYSEIPLYYRRKLKEKNITLHNELLLKFLHSKTYEKMKQNTKDNNYRDKKIDKLTQIKYKYNRYKIANAGQNIEEMEV